MEILVSLFQAVKRAPGLAERAETQLEDLIVQKSLKPSDRLPSERELGLQLGVSKTVVREAIRTLAAKGLVEIRPGSGTYVRDFSGEVMTQQISLLLRSGKLEAHHIHEVRSALEVEIAGFAAERASSADLEALDATILVLAAKSLTAMAFAEADVAFHQRLATAAGNPLFVVLMGAINDVMVEVRLQAFEHYREAVVKRAIHFHSEILHQVRTRNAGGARQAMEEHLIQSLDLLRRSGRS
ncbi:MAG TPA: FadR/GntR family transcriptional regulator [Bryobacteraceae bacterium]